MSMSSSGYSFQGCSYTDKLIELVKGMGVHTEPLKKKFFFQSSQGHQYLWWDHFLFQYIMTVCFDSVAWPFQLIPATQLSPHLGHNEYIKQLIVHLILLRVFVHQTIRCLIRRSCEVLKPQDQILKPLWYSEILKFGRYQFVGSSWNSKPISVFQDFLSHRCSGYQRDISERLIRDWLN